ncbi:phospholipid-binding protein MlaC [Magnetospira sp. QH-2]|uniref:MlaC/ttg2D family ABC transporter substrate-binding protein n=1 Tax=Magnetospira sp. (strain QH-2) TaxID=1288970 RepID=UPI0003E80A6A|nr:ABC transporter substrate-binding protein [Magnetospira sp. QH-2]CCQ72521.1 putative toluene tolerance protein [Magnetospira sp. QH-2]
MGTMMMTRRSFVAALAVVMMTFCWTGETRATAAEGGEAQKFIEAMAQRAIDTLTDQEVSRPDRIKAFREILKDNFAVEAIGRYVLSRYWNRATPEEKAEYLSLFEDLIVATYVDRFAEYAGEQLNIVGTEALDERDNMVHSLIEQAGSSQPVRVDWRVRDSGNGSQRIYDVMVNGVSMALTQRSEFGSVIAANGRTVAGLLEVLREKTKTLKE